MAKLIPNLGTPPSGSDGDTQRTVNLKFISNFNEVYDRVEDLEARVNTLDGQTTLSKSIAGGAGTVALTEEEAGHTVIDLTGAITGNKVVTVPDSIARTWAVRNSTTGAFSVQVKTASGSGIEIAAGASVVVVSDGTNVGVAQSGTLIGTPRVFTSSATYTPTPGTRSVIVEVQAGGGAGGGLPVTPVGYASSGGGGGAGGYLKHRMTSGFSGASIVVGAGGVGVLGSNGGAGGNSSFAGIQANGGAGGFIGPAGPGTSSAAGGEGGAASGGNIVNMTGGPGANSSFSGPLPGNGGDSMYGRGGVGRLNVQVGASGYGGGGGGTLNSSDRPAYVGAPGRPGIVIVWEYA